MIKAPEILNYFFSYTLKGMSWTKIEVKIDTVMMKILL